ncbi:hypothetical protein [Sulfurimonas sp. HSL3-7]|uniref:hypothetical protein n=1 Tax=Sulfonitrofixus jiaomeiensis TaxID=3131938 RepID=UPI0031FA2842
MTAPLSKLHIRFIQTQKNFVLTGENQSKGEKLPLSQLYVKNNSSFYFVNFNDTLQDGGQAELLFKEANDYLKSLQCKVSTEVIAPSSDEYEDGLLFFHVEPAQVKQLVLFTVETLSDN